MAGDIRTALLTRAKLYQQVYSATMWTWLSIFLECPAVWRANRFMLWRIVWLADVPPAVA